MHRRSGQWIQIVPSYIQDKLQRENEEGELFQLDTYRDNLGIIRVRIFSRFHNATKHQLWIAYIGPEDAENEEIVEAENPVLGYYFTCKSGARTLGTCAHVASVLWFLGYARYEQNVRYPSILLLNSVLDAAARPMKQNPNNGPEIPMDVD